MAVQIPETGGRLIWTGTNASIPASFQEDTDFAEKYLQGSNVSYTGPTNAGGSHDHTLPTHAHVGDAHNHTFTGSDITYSHTHGVYVGGAPNVSDDQHGHATPITTPSTSITYSTEQQNFLAKEPDPEHVEIIVIKIVAAAGDQDIPDDAVVFSDNIQLPTGFTKHASLAGKFLKAVASGGNSDLTGAGDATHNHITGGIGLHTHTASAHVHAAISAGPSTGLSQTVATRTPPTAFTNLLSHHPSVSMDSAASGDLSAALDSSTHSPEPEFIKLLALQNTSSGDKAPVPGSTIIPFVGAFGTIPAGWEFYAPGDSLQIKITGTDSEVEDTGGANLHIHTAEHLHAVSGGAHTHTATVSLTVSQVLAGSHPDDIIAGVGHTHTWTVAATLPTMPSLEVTFSSEDSRPPYRRVLWIKCKAARATLGTHHNSVREVLAA
jgi:hypothetical protein